MKKSEIATKDLPLVPLQGGPLPLSLTDLRLIILLVFCFIGLSPLTAEEQPAKLDLDGKLLFHRYSSYNAWDSQIFLYDFSAKTLRCLSREWPIDHAMNAHFSPDGKQIVFMGVPKGMHTSASWDIYLWDVGAAQPVNLTANNGKRDEDPQFSPDGKSIVFKQDGQIAFLSLENRKVDKLNSHNIEWSMPVFAPDDKHIVAMSGAAENGDLYSIDLLGKDLTPISNIPQVQEYFPVHWDKDRLLYVRWQGPANHNDQIYCYHWSQKKSEPMLFCQQDANYSDPCPVDASRVIFSSTRKGGLGGYDLFIGNTITGSVQALSIEGINTSLEELGACYLAK